MVSDVDANEVDDHAGRAAAYVLGALSPAEAEKYEDHLINCDRCAAIIAELSDAALAAMDTGTDEPAASRVADMALARLGSESGAERGKPAEVADHGVAGSTESASNVRRLQSSVQRWRTMALVSGVAAATLVVALVASAISGSESTETELAFGDAASGSITIDDRPWGTAVELDLIGLPERDVYQLYAVGVDGALTPVVSWPSSPEGYAIVSGGAPLDRSSIEEFIITSSDANDIVLTAPVDA